jgi:hypothetical protein
MNLILKAASETARVSKESSGGSQDTSAPVKWNAGASSSPVTLSQQFFNHQPNPTNQTAFRRIKWEFFHAWAISSIQT